jgi:hypothetical protein
MTKKNRAKLSLAKKPFDEENEDSDKLDDLQAGAPDAPTDASASDSPPMKRTTMYLPEDLHHWLKVHAAITNQTMADIVRAQLEALRDASDTQA